MNERKIRVLPDAAAVAAAAAELFVEHARNAVAMRDAFAVALAGGSTPRAMYELLATPTYASRVPWNRVEIYFGDERTVPPTDKASNYRMAEESLLRHVPIPGDNVYRMAGEIDPESAAKEYGQMLKSRFGDDGGPDLVLLGMGDDGHTLSLFPGTSAVNETKHRCVANHVPAQNTWRITMTAPFVNRAAHAIVMVTGSTKAQRLQEVLEGPESPDRLPIQLITPQGGSTWLIDAPAAGM